MQHLINRLALERAASAIFSGAAARYYLMGLLAVTVATVAGAAPAMIWAGLALLVDEARKALARRLETLSARDARLAGLGLDVAMATTFAAAPAMAWYSRGDLGGGLAVALLCVLAIDTALRARRGRLHAALTCAPYAALMMLFLLEGAAASALAPALACALVLTYVFTSALHQSHRAAHARRQDAEWVRQLNMSFGDATSAAWEVDFTRESLVGAERLTALLGRPATYDEVVRNGCFAAAADRALVTSAFAADRVGARRIALEHDVASSTGANLRVQHQGFVRTTPDGAPVRLTCVTRIAEPADDVGPMPDLTADIAAVLASQAETLRTLRNELSNKVPENLETTVDLPGLEGLKYTLQRIAERTRAIEDGVDDLAHARHAAESANLAKSQFLANMSHELRTPLNAVIGYAEMLKEDAEDNGDATAVQDLNRILAAAKHLLSLINEILDLSKIEAGRMDVAVSTFDPGVLLEDLVETIRPLADQNANTISFNATSVIVETKTDALKLRQCVLNLLSNACKFTRGGSIEVALETRVHDRVRQLFIAVRDTGIGMSREHQARLFQPFVQADPSITAQYGGTGLGLTITRRLAQLLGGDVSVVSELAGGSVFTLHVPLDFADASAALGAAAAIDAVQGAEDAPLVIVIEDEPDARELAARALTRAGFAVQGVGGGEAGLALARSKAPALVLLDIFLPDRSGWRVLQSLKHDPKTQDIPVVVLSVNEDRAHALALGAAEHIVKPADRDVLAATVMRFARKRPVQAPTKPEARRQTA